MKYYIVAMRDDFDPLKAEEDFCCDFIVKLFRDAKEVIDWQPGIVHERWEGKLFKLWATEEK